MKSIDVTSSRLEFGVSGGTPDLSTGTVSGRVRLFNIWPNFGTGAASGASYYMKFYNGSASGDLLFRYDTTGDAWANPWNNIIIPGDGIIFPDGLFVAVENSASGSFPVRIEAMTLIHQVG